MGQIAARFRWVFGAPLAGASETNRLGSTGAGVAYDVGGRGEAFTFYIDGTDSAYSYQIRSARTSSGPWAVLSSGTVASSASADVVQLPGPLDWLSPRIKTMGSTANQIVVRMMAVES